MSSKNIYRIAVIAAMAFGAFSCTENVEIAVPNDVVSFSASTSYKNLPETKTVYSGEEINVSGNAIERIDWVANDDHTDQVAIFNASNEKSATFKVVDPTSSGTNSSADLAFVSGDAITWVYGNNTFLSVYPSTAFNASTKTFGGTLPAVQVQSESHTTTAGLSGSNTSETVTTPTMDDYAFMVAKTVTAKTETVSLDYTLGVTAFEFNLAFAGDDANAPTISKFEMFSTSTPLVGTWSWDGTSFTCPTTLVTEGDNANNMITVNFDAGTTVSATNPLRFTVFALPHNISNLTVKFYLSTGTKTLALKTGGEFDTFDASKKYRITTPGISSGEWVYTLEEVVVGAGMSRTVYTSGTDTKGIYTYKTHVGDNGGYTDGQQLPVDVQFRYSLADEDGNNLGVYQDGLPAWLPTIDYTLASVDSPTDEVTLTGNFTEIPSVDRVIINKIDDHINSLKARGGNGATTASPQDLSMYDIDNLTATRTSGKPKTANTYVVDRSGWYMFPLVYGNAIDWEMGSATTGWNTMSYTDGTSGWDPAITTNNYEIEGFVLHTFRNYLDNDIDSPYIIDNVGGSTSDYEAVIVWEDKPYVAGSIYNFYSGTYMPYNAGEYPDSFINSASIVPNPTTSAVYKDADGGAKTVPYIKFEVDADNIREGNAIIALREKTGDHRIVWSWQIWVSDSEMTTTNLESRSPAVPSNDILNPPLGYTDEQVEQMFYYSDRDATGNDVPRICYVEVTHTESESTCAPLVFKVTHTADGLLVHTFHSVTMYQYGRKDPFYGTSGYRTGKIVNGEKRWMNSNTARYNKNATSQSGYTVAPSSTYGDLPHILISTVGAVSYGIQNPHMTINSDLEDPKPGGWTHSVSRNLWNMVETNDLAMPEQGATGGSSLRDYDSSKDRKVVKTVYDPCPPGFSIPNFGAFTLFSPEGSSVNTPVGRVNADADLWDPHVYYADAAQTRTISFYATNWRQWGGIGQTPWSFFYHTCKSRGNLYGCTWQDNGFYAPFGPVSDMARQHPVAVMAAKEIK